MIVDFAQLLDKPNYSLINTEALKCASGIRNNIFNDLQIKQVSDNVIHLQKEQIATYLSQLNKADIHILCYSNEKANEINLWIKQKLLNSGKTLAVGDIILFHNNIEFIANSLNPVLKILVRPNLVETFDFNASSSYLTYPLILIGMLSTAGYFVLILGQFI